jgi:hypothetical protein
MEASTRIIDYHLEERIEGKKPKIALLGRKYSLNRESMGGDLRSDNPNHSKKLVVKIDVTSE